MFDIAPTEFMLVVVVALLVIGPKDLPKAMRFVGKWLGKAKGMARHFRAGMDTMMREAELEELEKQWKAQNAEIMRQFPDSVDMDAAGKSQSSPIGKNDPKAAVSDGPDAGQRSDDASKAGQNLETTSQTEPAPDTVVSPETHKVPPPSDKLP